jgi:endogenous inhibitor of DNA gyrase (YacG/DUF329 family)
VSSSSKLVACPTCGKASPYGPDNRFRPFCCERCKLIDLGAWAEENYRVAVKGEDSDAVASEPAPDS